MKKGAASGRCENPVPSLRPNWWGFLGLTDLRHLQPEFWDFGQVCLHNRGRPWVRNGSGIARQDTGVILSEPGFA
jgi:hypothetical protein